MRMYEDIHIHIHITAYKEGAYHEAARNEAGVYPLTGGGTKL